MTVNFEIENKVARITLNRPSVYNSLNKELSTQLIEVLKECQENDEVRCLYLSGTGKGFCAGQDLKEVTASNDIDVTTVLERYNRLITLIRTIEKPIVAAVNGIAAGAGASLALSCDITLATESAVFIQAFSKIGLIPDSGGTFFLPRLVGMQRAAGLMMLADKVSATEAVAMGMIYKAFPDQSFEKEAFEIATRLSKMPTKALGLTKRALNYSLTNDLERQMAVEEQLQVIASMSQDFKEGVQAFIEKRQASFNGV